MEFFSGRRIWIDDSTYDKLNYLYQIGNGFIGKGDICRIIISEWISIGCNYEWVVIGNIKYIRVGNLIFDRYVQKSHYIWVFIEDSLWDEFRYLCARELDVNIGFKIAIHHFINLEETVLISLFLY